MVEVIQVYGNLLLFRRVHGTRENLQQYSITRRLILGVGCFLEITLLYGLLYWAFRDSLIGSVHTPADALYFSVATITTVGFGDIAATGTMRLVVASEAVTGVILSIALIARFVALLPGDDDTDA